MKTILNVLIATIVFYFFYMIWAGLLSKFIIPYLPDNENFSSSVGHCEIAYFSFLKSLSYLKHVFFHAEIEEIIFRFIPYTIIQILFLLTRKNVKPVLIICSVIMSGIFGYVHGNYINIFVQGVPGLFLSFIFLANGGYIIVRRGFVRNTIWLFWGLFLAIISHATINLLIKITHKIVTVLYTVTILFF